MLVKDGDRMRTPVHRPLPEQASVIDVPEQVASARSGEKVIVEEMSTFEAVAAFNLSRATLRRLLAAGSLPARKVNGVRGREWRIPASALEEAGYTRRPVVTEPEGVVPRSEVRRLHAALNATRARAAELDGQLGYALLTIGRLRGRLRAAGIDPNELFGADLARRCNGLPRPAPPTDEPACC